MARNVKKNNIDNIRRRIHEVSNPKPMTNKLDFSMKKLSESRHQNMKLKVILAISIAINILMIGEAIWTH